MKVKNYLIGARYLDFITKEGDEVRGTQVFLCNAELTNSDDNRIPEKVFIRKDITKSLNSALSKYDRDTLIPVECDVTLSGSKIVYNDIKLLDKI